jgi:hypothetical protein
MLLAGVALTIAQGPARGLELRQGPRSGHLIGHIEIGPLTPVQRPGDEPKVPPELYKKYRVEVQLLKNGALTILHVDSKGNFAANLVPGRYRVSVPARGLVPVPPAAQEVVITAGSTVRINFRVDTGIR